MAAVSASARLCLHLGRRPGCGLFARQAGLVARPLALLSAAKETNAAAATSVHHAPPDTSCPAVSSSRRCSTSWQFSSGSDVSIDELVRISYMSMMHGEGDELDRTVRQIAESAAVFNMKENITGFMSYDASLHTVWQILEGAPEAVMPLFHRIHQDGRHTVDEASVSIENAHRRAYPGGWGLKVRVRSANEI
mmetsp:Transcript_71252/g.159519  ORF Transcript_71252/g.159519 Transcript_71252/m.159519 type:complete len:193 (-) Transcript_71252:147-725(-)